jgi:Xaa-Pro aminopeptidase
VSSEVSRKIALLRETLVAGGLGAVRLRGVDAFAWLTGGASNVVLLAAETGVAEGLVDRTGAWLLTDAIEAPRFLAETAVPELALHAVPWQTRAAQDAFVRERAGALPVASDRPEGEERPLPETVVRARRRLGVEERERYRALGRAAAQAMTETLRAARPDWTELALAGRGAEALWRRGIEPALVLAAGADRVGRFRHPPPTEAPLGARAMLVFCGRRHGLYANLSRFVAFRPPTEPERLALARVARIEAAAWRASRPGALLSDVYAALGRAYAAEGVAEEIHRHHQGGTTGYRAREVVASPETALPLEAGNALAWNPSLPGTKIEDTVLLDEAGLEVLTVDDEWPTFDVAGVARPEVWVRD